VPQIMRIKITLSTEKPGIIDYNYQHQIQAVIYEFLATSDPDYSSWLHEQGYIYKKDKRFKLFVFSGILFNGPIKTVRSHNLSGFSFHASPINPFTFSFQIASPVDNFIQHLIDGIFQEGSEIILGRQKATISRIETLPDLLHDLSRFNGTSRLSLRPLESPIFVKKPMPAGQRDIYLFPGDEDFETFLSRNLLHKYETLHGKPWGGAPLKFEFHPVKGKSEKHFTIYKKGFDGDRKFIHIKGTLQPFTVAGPEALIRIGLECGFGQNNSMGCGYVEINRDEHDKRDGFD